MSKRIENFLFSQTQTQTIDEDGREDNNIIDCELDRTEIVGQVDDNTTTSTEKTPKGELMFNGTPLFAKPSVLNKISKRNRSNNSTPSSVTDSKNSQTNVHRRRKKTTLALTLKRLKSKLRQRVQLCLLIRPPPCRSAISS